MDNKQATIITVWIALAWGNLQGADLAFGRQGSSSASWQGALSQKTRQGWSTSPWTLIIPAMERDWEREKPLAMLVRAVVSHPVLITQLTACTVREAAQGSLLATSFWSQWGSIWYTPHLIPMAIRDCVSTRNNAHSHLKRLPSVSQKVKYFVSKQWTFFNEPTLYG